MILLKFFAPAEDYSTWLSVSARSVIVKNFKLVKPAHDDDNVISNKDSYFILWKLK